MKLITLTHPNIHCAELATICQPADTLLLRQDAVYLAQRTDINWPCQQVVALASDLTVRQISPAAGITVINNESWVQLAANAAQVLLWR